MPAVDLVALGGAQTRQSGHLGVEVIGDEVEVHPVLDRLVLGDLAESDTGTGDGRVGGDGGLGLVRAGVDGPAEGFGPEGAVALASWASKVTANTEMDMVICFLRYLRYGSRVGP